MKRAAAALTLASLLLLWLGGCSSKQAYEGLQAGQRSQCIKLPEPDRSRCEESTGVRYEDYEAQRRK